MAGRSGRVLYVRCPAKAGRYYFQTPLIPEAGLGVFGEI